MIRLTAAAALVMFFTGPAIAGSTPPVQSCEARLKTSEDGRALAEVKLEEEVERADAQAYLTRLELRVTQQRLAAALAKCGPACAGPAPSPGR